MQVDVRDVGSIYELGRSPGGKHGNPLQYSCLENPMDRGGCVCKYIYIYIYIYIFMFISICETRNKSERTHTRLLEGALWTLEFAGHFLSFYFIS